MSYLNYPRLCFAGTFQADVSTVNNDPRHYDNDTFQEHFQDFNTDTARNGLFNPVGTGIFRFADCTVRSYTLPDGTAHVPAQSTDPVLTWRIGNSPDRPSGKMVDLDPNWQFASQLYGLSVSLMDPDTHAIPLVGDFKPAPFRDLWFSRGTGGNPGDSAIYQSVLTNLRWDDALVEKSPFLTALRDRADNDMLSIRMTMFDYKMNPRDKDFAHGTVLGAIGLHRTGDPTSFVLGRRLCPTSWNKKEEVAAVLDRSDTPNLGFMAATIQDNTLIVDISNASPLPGPNQAEPERGLNIGILSDPDTTQASLLNQDEHVTLFKLLTTYKEIEIYSGIRSFPLTDEQIAMLQDHPLAVLKHVGPGKSVVALREGPDGLSLQCEDISFRLDPNDPDQTSKTSTLYATQYGVPLSGAKVGLWPQTLEQLLVITPPSPEPGTTPTAPVPFPNTPPNAVTLSQQTGITDANGTLQITFTAPDSEEWPRKYLDGQIYTYAYNFIDRPAVTQSKPDRISVLAFAKVSVPDVPTWEDAHPILQQYANLYPVMSQRMFNFADKEQADKNAHLMLFVFQKDPLDPDYMPVTRDLSAGRLEILVRYFQNVLNSQDGCAIPIKPRVEARCPIGKPHPNLEDIKHVMTSGKPRPA